MITIIVSPNQTVYDLAAQHYGTCEAVEEILQNNPGIKNDKKALVALNVDYLTDADFYLDAPVNPGTELNIDTDSKLIRTSVTNEFNTDITTYG